MKKDYYCRRSRIFKLCMISWSYHDTATEKQAVCRERNQSSFTDVRDLYASIYTYIHAHDFERCSMQSDSEERRESSDEDCGEGGEGCKIGGTITNDDDVTFGQFVGEHRASVERLNGSVVVGDSVVVVHYRAESIQLKRRDVHDIAYKSIFIEYMVFLVHTCA